VVVDSTSEAIYELNRELMLISTVDISASNQLFAAGITVAPATDDPNRYDFYIVDRGVDNDSDPNENDGRIYEMRTTLPPIINLAPDVSAGRDAPVTVGTSLQLRATVRDDGLPGPSTSVAWSRVSGPGVVNFATPDQAQTTAAFSAPGTYVVRATATDGALSSTDDVTVTVVPVGAPLPLDTPVAKAFDDVEQRPTGFADWLGSTLNIPRAGTTAQTIGIRFADLAVPPDADITEAWIQFRATGSTSGTASVQVRGIDQDNTATFTTSSTTVSSRPLTTAGSTWSPPAWTSGQAGAAQRTTDLSQIVQEILDRPGWQSGNALAFSMTGTGERRASSHDGVQAPVLHLAYTTSTQPPTNTPPEAEFSSQCSGLTCTFDGSDSSDNEGPIAGYQWTFPGDTATGVTAQHTFAAAGTYNVTLTVTDSNGATDSVTHPVTVSTTTSPIGFRAATRAINNSTTSTVTVPNAVRADDALLLFATLNATDTVVTPPAGWTQAANFVTSSQRTLVWQRVATATDPGRAITVGMNSTTKIVLQLAAYSGTSTTNPVAGLLTRSETVRTTSHPTPPTTISGSGPWVVSYWADKSSTTTDWVPPAGATPRDEAIGSGSGRITALIADTGGPAPTGNWPAQTATTNGESRAATITITLNPS
jgi:PKD repeat protein